MASRAMPPEPAADSLRLILGDCRERMRELADDSIHLILTDPPYFLDGLDSAWRKGKGDTPRATGTVGALPVGMRFDPKQGPALQAFMRDVAAEWMRVLAPGGFALVFSQPRLSHRMAVGIEDAGFEIRDLLAWRFTRKAQFKAFSQDHFVRKMPLDEDGKAALIRSLEGRKTPQLRPQFEAVVLAQKPREGTFVANWQTWRTGLIDAGCSLDGGAPSTVMTVEKPDSVEKGPAGGHLTPKPVDLLAHLIRLFSEEGQMVLDPFMGSGSTGVAALRTGRRCIGIDKEEAYLEISRRRAAEEAERAAAAPPPDSAPTDRKA
ncbi:MAG: putative methylase [Alphaproteobacteria bacterium]|nr:putative methylase [Alphaproteobacteria bacterium]